MHTITQELEQIFRQAFKKSGIDDNAPILLQNATRSEFGDYQINGIMAAAKSQKINPRTLAQNVIENLDYKDIIDKVEIAGPGFINLHIKNSYLGNYIKKYGNNPVCKNTQNEVVVVDYSSPNLAKEMHVGHLRSTIIGDSLVRIFEYLGNQVIRRNHVGDWGTQFGMLTAYLVEKETFNNQGISNTNFALNNLEEFYRQAKTKFDEDVNFANKARDYVVKLQSGDEYILEIWQKFVDLSLKHCELIYKKLGVKLTRDDAVGESHYNKQLKNIINILQQKNLLVESQGAKCVFLDEKDIESKEQTPFIVQKSDGGYLYATTDIAAVDDRVNQLHANRLVYVIDARQSLHMRQLFATCKKAGIAKSNTKMEHVAFGTMMGEDGKPFKTRSGDTIKLISLINEAEDRAFKMISEKNPTWDKSETQLLANEIAISSIKYADLSKNRISDYCFDINKMLAFEGNTAPYLLYAYIRIISIIRKNLDKNNNPIIDFLNNDIIINSQEEHNLAISITKFSDCVLLASKETYPHYLCTYLYELSGLFMKFYESCPILNAENKQLIASRLNLAYITAYTLETGLNLLGINTIKKM